MTIIEALQRLRDDLKTWVANNLRTKLDKNLGADNANKILSTDAEGTITASEDLTIGGAGEDDKLILVDPEERIIMEIGNIDEDFTGIATTDIRLIGEGESINVKNMLSSVSEYSKYIALINKRYPGMYFSVDKDLFIGAGYYLVTNSKERLATKNVFTTEVENGKVVIIENDLTFGENTIGSGFYKKTEAGLIKLNEGEYTYMEAPASQLSELRDDNSLANVIVEITEAAGQYKVGDYAYKETESSSLYKVEKYLSKDCIIDNTDLVISDTITITSSNTYYISEEGTINEAAKHEISSVEDYIATSANAGDILNITSDLIDTDIKAGFYTVDRDLNILNVSDIIREALDGEENPGGLTYTPISYLPIEGGCYPVSITKDINIGNITLPMYSKGMYVSTGTADATLYVITPDGTTYTAFRNNGVWESNRVAMLINSKNISSQTVAIANQIGTKTVGASDHPIYLQNGIPTPVTGLIGWHGSGEYAEVFNAVESNSAEGNCSHAEGSNTTAIGDCSHAEGFDTIARGNYSHSEGWETFASGPYSHAEGCQTEADGEGSHAEGFNTIALRFQHAQGHYNNTATAQEGIIYGASANATAFVIGNGTDSTAGASNAFRVTYSGDIYGSGAVKTSGQDYAEYFEWYDANPKAEDRRGYFVTLDGEKIKIAGQDDYILGIVSGQPAIIGNGDECWRGRYVIDEFGAYVTEEFEYEEKIQEEVLNDKTGETSTETKTITRTGIKYKDNPNYDYTRPYVHRADRQEWDAVGMVGVLAVRDDGTCQVNGYCKVAAGGIATAASERTLDTYRVIERVNDHIVKVILK